MSHPLRGFIVSAPSSGSGKTLVTLGLVAALRAAGHRVGVAKSGPDYIDTAFLAATSGRPAVNLDTWAMRDETIANVIVDAAEDCDLLVIEGAMGLFDGTAGGGGSTASLAAMLGLPVILVVDAKGQSQSAAALAEGFAGYDDTVTVAGVVLNRVASERHEALLREGFANRRVPVLGVIPRTLALELPSRHLGLVQARENGALETVVEQAAQLCGNGIDLAAVVDVARAPDPRTMGPPRALPPPGQRIAIADDDAFAFTYRHILQGWRLAGAEILPFSPLAGDAPAPDADAVYLPGGYPELHAGRLAGNARFLNGVRKAAERGSTVFGECGGYMVLGRVLIDGQGQRHAMAGLLGVETSFADKKLHLGYRAARVLADAAGLAAGTTVRGHEFHYAATLGEEGAPLFDVRDSEGNPKGNAGLVHGKVAGSFLHVIDTA